MSLLFEATALDFELSIENSSFLDSTWTIPVCLTVTLPPIKILDITVGYVDDMALIVEVEEDCLAHKAGVETGDILDELCGEPVLNTSHGKLKQILVAKSQEATQLTVVKKHLPDGSPFQPILQRHLLHEERSEVGPTLSNPLPIPQRRQSNLVKTRGGGSVEWPLAHERSAF